MGKGVSMDIVKVPIHIVLSMHKVVKLLAPEFRVDLPMLILDIDSKIQLVVVELSPHAHFNYTFSIHKATHFV